jgi:hypothetical protein
MLLIHRAPRASLRVRLDALNDRTFLVASLMSVAAIVFATELRFVQRILDTVGADRQPVADLHRGGPRDHRERHDGSGQRAHLEADVLDERSRLTMVWA